MTISMQSFDALPPRQALALALAEKARRLKVRQAVAARTSEAELLQQQEGGSYEAPPPKDVPSVVLDRTHPISDLYFRKARYKVLWGGRGSVKTWGSAEALVRLAAALPVRVLGCREFMNSIKDSSHRILKDTIERLGLSSWFDITKDSIKSRSGAEFLFKGLHNNEAGIRSTEGIDICLVEEAQSVSDTSWQALIPTIRKPGSEIWVLFNMNEETDATYQRMVVRLAGDPDAIVHKINYDQNPFFEGTELYKEMLRDKRSDYELYEHIWLGMPRKRSNAIIFGGKYVVMDFPDDLYLKADRLLYGADFGFAEDPNTLIRFFILDVPAEECDGNDEQQDLYIEYEAYGLHVELNEMEAFYAGGASPVRPAVEFPGVPGSKDWPIKADCARPETISHVRGLGFAISAAEKWDGSVKDGITHIRKFRRIVIHTRCVHTAKEAYAYRFKVDPKQLDERGQPMVLPIVVDKHNHCWDAVRYGLDGHIQRSGALGAWARIGKADQKLQTPEQKALGAKWSRLASPT